MLLHAQDGVPVPCTDEIIQDIQDWLWDTEGVEKIEERVKEDDNAKDEGGLSEV